MSLTVGAEGPQCRLEMESPVGDNLSDEQQFVLSLQKAQDPMQPRNSLQQLPAVRKQGLRL